MNKIVKSIAKTISLLGHFVVFAFFVLLFFLFAPGWFFLPFGLMLAFTTIIAYMIKIIFPTKRPDFNPKVKPKNWWEKVDRGSFPSAHTMRAAGLFVITLYDASLFIQIAAATFLILIGASRIILRRHWWYDVVAGAVLGALCAVLAWELSPFFAPFFVWGSYIMLYKPA